MDRGGRGFVAAEQVDHRLINQRAKRLLPGRVAADHFLSPGWMTRANCVPRQPVVRAMAAIASGMMHEPSERSMGVLS